MITSQNTSREGINAAVAQAYAQRGRYLTPITKERNEICRECEVMDCDNCKGVAQKRPKSQCGALQEKDDYPKIFESKCLRCEKKIHSVEPKAIFCDGCLQLMPNYRGKPKEYQDAEDLLLIEERKSEPSTPFKCG